MTRDASPLPENLWLGTSSWSSDDWVGPFYPAGTAPGEYLVHYSRHFRSVEIDSTFYRAPRAAMVDGWRSKTPDGFVFSAKVPRLITHERALADCRQEMDDFVRVMERLGGKLGPLVLQFEYVAKGKDADEYRTGAKFVSRLAPFVMALPKGPRYVVEVRNENWLGERLFDALRAGGVQLALTDYFTMPPVEVLLEKVDVRAADFHYIRFLGHHRRMDQLVKEQVEAGKRQAEWSSLAMDRTKEMQRWVPAVKDLALRKVPTYAYFNNHYAGYGPGSVALFEKVWREAGA